MILRTDKYTFWVDYYEDDVIPGTYFYTVGNPKHKSKPCIRLMVCLSNREKKYDIIIQSINYYNTCAKEGLA